MRHNSFSNLFCAGLELTRFGEFGGEGHEAQGRGALIAG
jgi:hypothetical protein